MTKSCNEVDAEEQKVLLDVVTGLVEARGRNVVRQAKVRKKKEVSGGTYESVNGSQARVSITQGVKNHTRRR